MPRVWTFLYCPVKKNHCFHFFFFFLKSNVTTWLKVMSQSGYWINKANCKVCNTFFYLYVYLCISCSYVFFFKSHSLIKSYYSFTQFNYSSVHLSIYYSPRLLLFTINITQQQQTIIKTHPILSPLMHTFISFLLYSLFLRFRHEQYREQNANLANRPGSHGALARKIWLDIRPVWLLWKSEDGTRNTFG